jgi:ketosteroid isomerase-like protein
MATKKRAKGNEDIVKRYFEYIRTLRQGDQESVDKLMSLWADDGIFEFAGAPPVTGLYQGRNAIRTIYKNRASSAGMPLSAPGAASKAGALREAALGEVDTQVHKSRLLTGNGDGERMAVSWTTRVATADGRGYDVSGAHTFTFKDGHISQLRVVVSPKAEEAEGLRLDGLSVSDIGRLSLAAWMVV